MQSRRHLLRTAGVALAGVTLSGCMTDGSGTGTSTGTATGMPGGTATGTGTKTPDERGNTVTADVAVAAEWTAMEARVYDALALGEAGLWSQGVAVAKDVFARFEKASGEYGAHTKLEETDAKAYEEFEEALSELAEAGLGAEDLERARTEAGLAAEQLATARRTLVGEQVGAAMSVLALGARTADARWLAAAEKLDAAAAVAGSTYGAFEEAAAHGALESADGELYEAFEGAVEATEKRAQAGDAAGTRKRAETALSKAVAGAYAVAPAKPAAGAGHLAVMQARGFDAAVLATMGGPGSGFAHAAALNGYRARAYDAAWLTASGEGDHAAELAKDTFAHFEGARAHEALESADHDAYERFEGGLQTLRSKASSGAADAASEAASRIDAALVSGQTALAGAQAPVLESAFFRIRLGDAAERYHRGESAVAATLAESLFERFEKDEAGFHETFEHYDHEAYETFEGHLGSLATAFENGDDAAVDEHLTGTLDALTGFETGVGSTAVAASAEASVMAARVFDAHVQATLGASDRASAVVSTAFEGFEKNQAGFHEALEGADPETYEAFEKALDAAKSGDYGAAKSFYGTAVDAIYAVVGAAGGSHGKAATSIVQATFESFENATVHELLESADHDAYEAFEKRLGALSSAIESGSGVRGATTAFARAALRAQFAVVGAVGKAPVGKVKTGGGDENLKGGPNVVDGVPGDADHVVDMKAVSYAPKKLTVSAGDTVAWKHTGGEAHTVTARQDGIPDGASYWASGGFGSEKKARQGWENGKGAVTSDRVYVHTFETAGEHAYYCIPHEAAGMEGTVVVE